MLWDIAVFLSFWVAAYFLAKLENYLFKPKPPTNLTYKVIGVEHAIKGKS